MQEQVKPPAGRLVRLGVVLPLDISSALHVAGLCDRISIDVLWAADEAQAEGVRPLVNRVEIAVRPAVDEVWARTIAVSIGRTRVEAAARAAMDARLAGFDESLRAVGSLEDCQAIVAKLAAEGVTDLRCVLPDTPDVHDVLAQLTAIAFAPS